MCKKSINDTIKLNKKLYVFTDNKICFSKKIFYLYIAETETQKQIGLSEFKILPKNFGMLFIYDKIGRNGIWMKNMTIPIDIIWLNEKSVIIKIEKNIKPETYPKIYGYDVLSKFVVEINAGESDKNNINVGDKLLLLN